MFQFNFFKPYSDKIIHGITTAEEGDFNDESPNFEQNIKWLKNHVGIRQPIYAKQMHTDIILHVDRPPKVPPVADAFITWKKHLPLMVKVADCQGILIYDKKRDAIAAVHSGWRGSIQNILGKTIQSMQKAFNSHPSNLLIGIGPSLGPCCSEFSDPEKELPAFCKPYVLENNHVDFWQMSLDQCLDMNVPEKNIEIAHHCTKCQSGYYSHRLEHKQRIACFIGLK